MTGEERDSIAEAGSWLARQGYPVDFHTDKMPPPALWAAVVDAVHRNEGGNWHGGDLSRADVDAWLRDEADYPQVPAGHGHGHDGCPDGPDAHKDYCLNGRQE